MNCIGAIAREHLPAAAEPRSFETCGGGISVDGHRFIDRNQGTGMSLLLLFRHLRPLAERKNRLNVQ
jgi:hypothetical protein